MDDRGGDKKRAELVMRHGSRKVLTGGNGLYSDEICVWRAPSTGTARQVLRAELSKAVGDRKRVWKSWRLTKRSGSGPCGEAANQKHALAALGTKYGG